MSTPVDPQQRIASLEAENQRLEVALERSRGEVDQLLNLAGHDLQAPVRTVRMFLDLLLTTEDTGLSDKARQYIGHCITAAGHGEVLVRRLLEYTRVDTQGGAFEPVALVDPAREAIAGLQGELDAAGAQVSVGELPSVTGDPKQLQDVFSALVDNALRYRSDAPLVIQVEAATHPGGHWEIRVVDNGTGVEPQYLDAAFEPFRRVHRKAGIAGTGLGLAIVRRIVGRHGGEVGVRSDWGAGSTFWLTLPADPVGGG